MGSNARSQPQELDHIISLSEPKLIITNRDALPTVLDASANNGMLPSQVIVLDDPAAEQIAQLVGSGPVPYLESGDEHCLDFAHLLGYGENDWIRFDNEMIAKSTPAALFSTSGTGGLPKAAVLSHHAMVSQHLALAYDVPYEVRRLMSLPMFHLFGALWSHIFPIRYGQPLYILPRFEITQYLKSGDHDFPFSYLFPGDVPASCSSSLGQIEYFLQAHGRNINGEEYKFKMPLHVRRAILPGNDKSSIRIFPPTNLTGRIVLPSVVHPIGTFPVQMTLSGVLDKGDETQTRWRLRKMMWRIEEHQKIVSTACAKHTHKIGGEGKGVLHQETRIIGHNEEKDGWKSDFDTAGGEISMEFEASINPTSNPVCDLEAQGGLEARHNLVIELIVAEEFCPNRNTRLITPTGAARVLRMQFNLHVTERSGLGISWDEEMPPVYEDVPASPPGYAMLDGGSTMEDYHGSPLPTPDYEELDRMDSLRLDTSSTNSSCRGRGRLTTDDLTTEPLEIGSRNRVPSADSQQP